MKTKEPTFEDSLNMARQIMTRAGQDAAKMLGLPEPSLREEKTASGVRMVTVWADGAETNECLVERLDTHAPAN